ncbi:LOW QUALITY PROTEIN: CUB and zona pellucida-like domain-containing protein 1 [Megaptera novaeangliae]
MIPTPFLLAHSREVQHSYSLITVTRKLTFKKKEKEKQLYFFESSSFGKPMLESLYVGLNQTFVQVSLCTSDPNLVVFQDTCSTTPTDFASPTCDLSKSGCNDETCKARFQFNSFEFLRCLGSVYLECKFHSGSSNQSHCHQTVFLRKRDISSYKKTNSVIGCIHLKRDRASGNSEFQYQTHETQIQPFNNLHLFSFMVLVLNIVIVATILARHFVSQRTDYKVQKLQDY